MSKRDSSFSLVLQSLIILLVNLKSLVLRDHLRIIKNANYLSLKDLSENIKYNFVVRNGITIANRHFGKLEDHNWKVVSSNLDSRCICFF